jgi:phage FluMu protein Com
MRDSVNAPSFKIRCPKCGVRLKAKETSIGKRKKCPNCLVEFEVHKVSLRDTDEIPVPATQAQKNHARSLGILFPLDISVADLESLIHETISKRSGGFN